MEIRINELDLTRAGIISVQRDLAPSEISWETEYTIGEVMYRVTGSAFHGRPHGRDADVLLALQTLFSERAAQSRIRLNFPQLNCLRPVGIPEMVNIMQACVSLCCVSVE
ncbi:hypothetical protein [Deinococcus radiophilus]|uniref:hypothetical protein n=1 Tax=Deinococcus radiophilus TaxID=32062 RepID=UPI00361F4F16